MHAIHALCVIRHGDALARRFPAGGVTYKGGGFGSAPELKEFFSEGKQYRVAGFLATSFDQSVARCFIFTAEAAGNAEQVLWVVNIDPAGEMTPAKRAQHVNYVFNSHIVDAAGQPREAEFLFALYLIFTVRSVTWGHGAPHRIEIDAASDNREEAAGGGGGR